MREKLNENRKKKENKEMRKMSERMRNILRKKCEDMSLRKLNAKKIVLKINKKKKQKKKTTTNAKKYR